jgi:hypothetical protein
MYADSETIPAHVMHPTAGGSHFPGAYGDHDTSAQPAAGGSHFPGAFGEHDTTAAAHHGMDEEEEEEEDGHGGYYHEPQHGDSFLEMDEEHPDNY